MTLRFPAISPRRAATVAALAAVLLATPALAQQAPAPVPLPAPGALAPAISAADLEINPVVAIVNGGEIRLAEVYLLYESLGEQVTQQLPFSMLYPQLVDGTISRKLLAERAVAAGLEDDESVLRRIAFWTERVLEERFVAEAVDAGLSEEALRTRYEEFAAESGGLEEVRASHIIVESQAEAYDIVEALAGGALFGDLARQFSQDGAAASGGDLGFFARDGVVREFAEAAFVMEIGEYSTEPVQTSFGWHVILLTDRRVAPPPTFEESVDQLRAQLNRDLVSQIYDNAAEGAEVQRFNPDGSPMAAPEPLPAAAP